MSFPRKVRCAVTSVVAHGGRVYTVDLLPVSPVPAFEPGQFLHLTVDDYDPAGFWPESRIFSIASSPRDRRRIRICYSVTGRYTAKMEQALKVGGQVWVKLPYGDFVIEDGSDAVLIAGGTGISAFTAFLEALTPECRRSVTLVYGARMPELLLFDDVIVKQLLRVPRFDVLFFVESDDAGFGARMSTSPKPPRTFSGRITLDLVWPQLIGPVRQVFYLSGPPGMIRGLTDELQARGVDAQHIRTDAWQ